MIDTHETVLVLYRELAARSLEISAGQFASMPEEVVDSIWEDDTAFVLDAFGFYRVFQFLRPLGADLYEIWVWDPLSENEVPLGVCNGDFPIYVELA